MMSARSRKSRAAGTSKKKTPAEPLDKKDEVWCYVLVKLFTAMLEDPEEAKRLLKTPKSAFDVDLEPAVEQLKKAIDRKKSEHSTIITNKKSTSKVSTFTADTRSYDESASTSRSTTSESSSSSSSSVTLEDLFKALSKAYKTKSSRTISTTNPQNGRGERSRNLSSFMSLQEAERG